MRWIFLPEVVNELHFTGQVKLAFVVFPIVSQQRFRLLEQVWVSFVTKKDCVYLYVRVTLELNPSKTASIRSKTENHH